MFSSNYDPFDDYFEPSYFGTPFSSPYERRRRQELARRQQMEAERRHKLELERRRLMQIEMERERHRELEMMRRQRMMKEEQAQHRGRYSHGRVFLGPDGNLYRLVPPTERYEQERTANKAGNTQRSTIGEKKFSAENESRAKEHKSIHAEPHSFAGREDCTMNDCGSHSNEDFFDALDILPNVQHAEEVQVEDVPDEEDEELREMHSIWRNRTPSPGQWMEPVDITTQTI